MYVPARRTNIVLSFEMKGPDSMSLGPSFVWSSVADELRRLGAVSRARLKGALGVALHDVAKDRVNALKQLCRDNYTARLGVVGDLLRA